jgi:ABC-2 type transport system permease protein
MFKQQVPKIAKLSAGIILYEGLLTWVYPVISKNTQVTEIARSLPAAVKTVFGVSREARTDTFDAFISAQFLARIWAVLIIFYNLEASQELLGKLIDDGSLSFLLATPVERGEILETQAAVLLSSDAILVLMTLLGLYYGTYRFDISIKHEDYLRFALTGLAFYSFIGAYSLFFSAWLGGGENAFTIACALTLGFYAMDVAGGLSDDLAWAKKLSLFRCYQPQAVLEKTVRARRSILSLTAGTLFLLHRGKKVFEEKDLPI